MWWIGVEVHIHSFVAFILDGGQWSALCPGHFTPPRGRTHGIHLIGSWEARRADEKDLDKKNVSCPYYVLKNFPIAQHTA
jgi:hypothetical protein